MSKPFEVRECNQGIDIHWRTSDHHGRDYHIYELLTVEEAEDLAHQLLDAARERRMNAEDYNV
jgi:hypothetical protein